LKADSIITKELDLAKFFHRQRVQTHAILALLTGKQSYLVEKMSNLIIRESSDFSNTSFDSELSAWEKENAQIYRQLPESKDKTDKRIVDIFMLSKAA